MAKKQPKKILVIPDPQVEPGQNLDHHEAAGNWVKVNKPDIIVHLGDHFDFPSLSGFDKGKKSFEGRRIKADIRAGIEAFDRFFKPFKKTRAEIETYFIRGNHEYRLDRLLENMAELDEMISPGDLRLEEYWDHVVEYKKYITIEGIDFTHHFTHGVMDKVISGATPALMANNILNKKKVSGIQGHCPVWGHANTTIRGKKRIALVAGCFFANNSGYMSQSGNEDYWRGLTVLHDVEDGEFDVEQVSFKRLMKNYY